MSICLEGFGNTSAEYPGYEEGTMVEIDYAMICDAAQVPPDGKVYILGGGFDCVYSPQFPLVIPHLSIASKLLLSGQDSAISHTMTLSLIDADGNAMMPPLSVELPPQQTQRPGYPNNVGQVYNLIHTQFPKEGDYRFEIAIDGQVRKTFTLSLLHVSKMPGQR
jgi:hypothetical protein